MGGWVGGYSFVATQNSISKVEMESRKCICGKKRTNLNNTNWSRHLSSCKKVKWSLTSQSVSSFFKKSRRTTDTDYPDLTNNRKETQNNVPVLLNNCLIGQPNDDSELESTNPDIESSTAIKMNSASSSEVVTQVPSAYKELNDLGNDPAILSKIENIDPGLISYFLKIGAAQPLPCELPDKQFPRDHNGRSFHESWYWNKRSTGEVLQRKWLSYSIKNKKVYCLYCALFARNNKPNWTRHWFSNWNKGTTSIIMHETSEAHIMASIKAAYRQAEYPLIQSMKESVVANIAFNKEIVKHLIDLTLYLGRHSLPFRGHREGWQENIRGNYKDLVLLLAKYSPALASYVTSVELKGRKTYNFISWQRQNQLIEAIYRNIYDVIKKEILTAVFFSISLDTTFDVSRKEQLSLVIRYINKEDGTVCERLVALRETVLTTGKHLLTMLDTICSEMSLDWRANLVGQSYDGAASMKGSYNGLQSLVKKENPCAVYREVAETNVIPKDAFKGFSEIYGKFVDEESLKHEYIQFSKSYFDFEKIMNLPLKFDDTNKDSWIQFDTDSDDDNGDDIQYNKIDQYSKENSGTINTIYKVVHLSGLKEIFPTMYTALSIAVTLPVSSASPERAFSKLKLVKTHLRSTMSEDRLEALMIMACELDDCNKCPKTIKAAFQSDSSSFQSVNNIENNICDEPEAISSSNNCHNMLDSWITNITTTSTPNKERIRHSTPSTIRCLSESPSTSSNLSNTFTINQFVDKVSKDEKLELDSMLAKAIYASGSPLSLLDNIYWKKLFETLRPAYVLPSSYQLSNKLLDKIALRGHKDYGKIDMECSLNQGNFRAILKYRAYGDEMLKHIITSEGRNKYLTPQIQNEIITACGDIMLRKIVKDRFLKCITINSLTGCDLAESILNGLNSCEINLDYLYGQGYDGASNMSGHYKGVQAVIKKKYPKAIYVHCTAHFLNLAVSTASGIQPVRNCLEFLISLQVIQLVFSFGLPLCKLLQKEQIDLREAVSLAEDIINVLKNIGLNCDTEFHKMFLLAKEMSVIIDIDLSTKRISKRQVNRANPDPNLSVEEYHKVSVFKPYLDFFIQQLGERFSIHSEIFKGFQSLFSYTLTSNEEVSFRKLLEFYSPSLDVNNSIAELKLWKIKLERINNIPKTAIEALHVCNANIYPNVHFILKILCTLPVSTSTPERMFSSLKRIKTYLQNCMSEKRLNGLAMLAIHNDITFSNEEVIDELAKKPRNLDIIL
ncbi:hypothetical protein QTP88_017633 [Uroleucon formosanum]